MNKKDKIFSKKRWLEFLFCNSRFFRLNSENKNKKKQEIRGFHLLINWFFTIKIQQIEVRVATITKNAKLEKKIRITKIIAQK